MSCHHHHQPHVFHVNERGVEHGGPRTIEFIGKIFPMEFWGGSGSDWGWGEWPVRYRQRKGRGLGDPRCCDGMRFRWEACGSLALEGSKNIISQPCKERFKHCFYIIRSLPRDQTRYKLNPNVMTSDFFPPKPPFYSSREKQASEKAHVAKSQNKSPNSGTLIFLLFAWTADKGYYQQTLNHDIKALPTF